MKESGIAVCLGAADCLFDDLREASKLVDPRGCIVVAANDAGCLWPYRLDHWCTLHPEELWLRKRKRTNNGYPDGYETWTRVWDFGLKHKEEKCDHVLDGYNGSSGLLCVGVAIEHCRAERIILCGMPMDDRRHITRGRKWVSGPGFRDRWEALEGALHRRVRSFSGWTMETFGEPTADWLSPYISHNTSPDTTAAGVDFMQHLDVG